MVDTSENHTPLHEWITLFDPEIEPGLSFESRHESLLKKTLEVTKKHRDPKSASKLYEALRDNSL